MDGCVLERRICLFHDVVILLSAHVSDEITSRASKHQKPEMEKAIPAVYHIFYNIKHFTTEWCNVQVCTGFYFSVWLDKTNKLSHSPLHITGHFKAIQFLRHFPRVEMAKSHSEVIKQIVNCKASL